MSHSNYELLEAWEDILRADRRTKGYSVELLSTPDEIPGPGTTPLISIYPRAKGRTETRISGNVEPYTAIPLFDFILWESSVGDLKGAYKLLDELEENVYPVLLENRTVGGKVSTSVIGDTVYDATLHQGTFFVQATIPVTMEQKQ